METSSDPATQSIKYAVVGAGAVGCYYGGRLAERGGDVHFLMRSDLAAVRENGLTVHSPGGDFHLRNVNAHASTAEIGPCDAVLIALKTTSNAALEELIPPLLKEETLLLTLQNGLGNEEFLAERFGAQRVLGGICFVCLNRVAPGVIEHIGHGSLSIGEFGRKPLPRTHGIADQFKRSGIDARAVNDLMEERWRKLVWNIPFNGLSVAAGGCNVAEILADEGLRTLAENLMREVVGAANRQGYHIPPEFIDEQHARTFPMGPYEPSSLIDYKLGREIEVESIWGEPYRRAVAAGAKAERLETLYFLLRNIAKARHAPSARSRL